MEYEIEERPLQMGEDWQPDRAIGLGHPRFRPAQAPRGTPESRDRAMAIPEQEPLS